MDIVEKLRSDHCPDMKLLDQAADEIERLRAELNKSVMDYAVAAGDKTLLNEQAALLRECRKALSSLIEQKPTVALVVCGSTTLGKLKDSLFEYRPKGVFGE